MNRRIVRTIAYASIALVVALGTVCHAQTKDSKALHSQMAPLDQYLMADRNAEITLARSAAPKSISRDAEVLVLGRHGYETAVKGKNGFVCIVERSWLDPFDDPQFWSTDERLPLCMNAPAARTHLPLTSKTTELALAGLSRTQLFDAIKTAYDKKELPLPEPRLNVLHDVKATVLWPQVQKRRSPSDVLVPQDRRYDLGRRSAWITGVRASILSTTDHRVHHFSVQMVGRDNRRGIIAVGRHRPL